MSSQGTWGHLLDVVFLSLWNLPNITKTHCYKMQWSWLNGNFQSTTGSWGSTWPKYLCDRSWTRSSALALKYITAWHRFVFLDLADWMLLLLVFFFLMAISEFVLVSLVIWSKSWFSGCWSEVVHQGSTGSWTTLLISSLNRGDDVTVRLSMDYCLWTAFSGWQDMTWT